MKKPKERFLEKADAVKYMLDVTENSMFIAACDAAMLQLVGELDATPDPHASSASHHMVMGARRFVTLLSSIAETPPPPQPRGRSDNLGQH